MKGIDKQIEQVGTNPGYSSKKITKEFIEKTLRDLMYSKDTSQMISANLGKERGLSYNPMMDLLESTLYGRGYVVPITKIRLKIDKKISLWRRFINWIESVKGNRNLLSGL